MTTRRFPALRRVCEAVPETELDERLESLSALQRLVVFVLSGVTVGTVAPALADGDGLPAVAVILALGAVRAVTDLIAWYDRR